MKLNRKYPEVLVNLRHVIEFNLKKDNLLLPGERRLAADLNTSRVTLRKALAILEKEKLIFKNSRGIHILRENKVENMPGFAFYTEGHNDVFVFPAYERLWRELSRLAPEYGLRANLILEDLKYGKSEYADVLNSSRCLLIAGVPYPTDKRLPFLKKFSVPIISLDESLNDKFDSHICLDNFEAGSLAALSLAKAGYQRPAFLGYRRPLQNRPFLNRAEGFKAGLLESNLYFSEDQFRWIDVKRHTDFPLPAKEQLNLLVEQKFDAAFIFTDEWIDFITSDLFKAGLIPAAFGLITLNGSNAALRHHPVITSVGHGSIEVAREALSFINKSLHGGTPFTIRKKVPPSVHWGESLRD